MKCWEREILYFYCLSTLTINNILRLFSIAGFSYAISSDLATLVLLALGIVVIAVRESYSNFEALNLSFCLKRNTLYMFFFLYCKYWPIGVLYDILMTAHARTESHLHAT